MYNNSGNVTPDLKAYHKLCIHCKVNNQLLQKERSAIYFNPALSGYLGHERTDVITARKLDSMQNTCK